MALQDLTPQLRTRLGRVERLVGLFVILALVLLLSGFGYYVNHLAERKGWFLGKVPYYTLLFNATGLKEGDSVKLMGFEAGWITEIETMPPDQYYGIYVQFHIKEPYYGYIWKDSQAKVGAADFLGKRYIEVTKGTRAPASVLEITNRTIFGQAKVVPWGLLDDKSPSETPRYLELTKGTKGYFLPPDESPAVTEKLNDVIRAVEAAVPDLTNALTQVLRSSMQMTSNLNALVANAQPLVTNLTAISENLREPKGSLGEWILPTNIHRQLEITLDNAGGALTNASGTLSSVRTNLDLLAANINRSLTNLAELTGNLNAQVQANSFILSEISALIVSLDDMVQGLKRHWLLRSSFGAQPPAAPPQSLLEPSVEEKK